MVDLVEVVDLKVVVAPNTGGGGGSGHDGSNGGAGGSGIIVVRYLV